MWVPGKAKRQQQRDMERQAVALRAQLEMRRRVEEQMAAKLAQQADRRDGGIVRAVRRLAFRGRRILTPFGVLAAVLVLAPAGVGASLVWLVGAGLWWLARGRRRVDRRPERAYAAACVAAGAVFFALAGWLGLGAVAGWCVLGWTALSAPWWVHHWPRPRPPVPVPVVVEQTETIEDLWRANVAASSRAMQDSTLYAHEFTTHGQAWAIQAVPGAAGQQLGGVLGKLPQIAQGLRTPQELIVIDPHPDTNDPSVFRLQVIERSPIKKPVAFDEPRWKDGAVLLGPHADGIGEAPWRVYTDNSMWGGFFLGGTGSGKTSLLNGLAVTVRDMSTNGYPTVIIYVDGQDGASSSLLWHHATWSVGPTGANALLCALERGMAIRQKWNRVHRLSGFTPGASPDGKSSGLPGVLVIIDEQHRIFNSNNGLRWSNVAREGRKVGVGVIGADQYSDLETFGGKDVLRSSLLAGNGAAMRTQSNTAGDLIPGVMLEPADFPDLPGYGYKISTSGASGRIVPFRSRFLPDEKQAAGIPNFSALTAEEWFAKTADAELDEMTAREFGAVFTDRHKLAEEATRRAKAEIEGRTLVDLTKRPRAAPAAPPAPAMQAGAEGEDHGNAREEIIALLAAGPMDRPALFLASARGESSVKQALTVLVREGLIRRTAPGAYELVTDALAAA